MSETKPERSPFPTTPPLLSLPINENTMLGSLLYDHDEERYGILHAWRGDSIAVQIPFGTLLTEESRYGWRVVVETMTPENAPAGTRIRRAEGGNGGQYDTRTVMEWDERGVWAGGAGMADHRVIAKNWAVEVQYLLMETEPESEPEAEQSEPEAEQAETPGFDGDRLYYQYVSSNHDSESPTIHTGYYAEKTEPEQAAPDNTGNTHYAVVVNISGGMRQVACGDEGYCTTMLTAWLLNHPLEPYETAEILARPRHIITHR